MENGKSGSDSSEKDKSEDVLKTQIVTDPSLPLSPLEQAKIVEYMRNNHCHFCTNEAQTKAFKALCCEINRCRRFVHGWILRRREFEAKMAHLHRVDLEEASAANTKKALEAASAEITKDASTMPRPTTGGKSLKRVFEKICDVKQSAALTSSEGSENEIVVSTSRPTFASTSRQGYGTVASQTTGPLPRSARKESVGNKSKKYIYVDNAKHTSSDDNAESDGHKSKSCRFVHSIYSSDEAAKNIQVQPTSYNQFFGGVTSENSAAVRDVPGPITFGLPLSTSSLLSQSTGNDGKACDDDDAGDDDEEYAQQSGNDGNAGGDYDYYADSATRMSLDNEDAQLSMAIEASLQDKYRKQAIDDDKTDYDSSSDKEYEKQFQESYGATSVSNRGVAMAGRQVTDALPLASNSTASPSVTTAVRTNDASMEENSVLEELSIAEGSYTEEVESCDESMHTLYRAIGDEDDDSKKARKRMVEHVMKLCKIKDRCSMYQCLAKHSWDVEKTVNSYKNSHHRRCVISEPQVINPTAIHRIARRGGVVRIPGIKY